MAKKFHEDAIFILEGYADVIASRLAGYDNVVAIGGTALTDDHVMLLRELSCNNLVIAMDGDKTGTQKTGDLIEKLGEFPGITVEVLRLPPNAEEKDVDGYIRKNGEKAWEEAQQTVITAFQWTLQNRPRNEDKFKTLERAVKAIVPIAFPAQVYRMCDELSSELDIPLEIVRDEVRVKKDSDKAKQEAEMLAFGETVQRQIQRRPQDIRSILSHANNFIGTIDKKSKLNPIDPADQIAKLSAHMKREDETSNTKGIMMGWPEFDSKMYGIPPNDTWIVLGGKANAGKTSMCANMVYNAIQNNEDVISVIYTIDDSYSRFMPRLISLHAGLRTSWVSKRKTVEEHHPGIMRKVAESYRHFADLMRAGKLYVWDIRDGNTWAFANAQLARLRQENPKAKILMVLDNFHLLQDFTGESTVQNYSRLSNMVANTVKEQEIALISTVEYHKLKKRVRPENQSIHYTQQLDYDSHLMLHLVNYQDEFEKANTLYWESKRAEDQRSIPGPDGQPTQVGYRKPITEVIVGKSKLEEFKGNIFFRFDPARCLFTECDEREMARCRKEGPGHKWIESKS
jgi:replicative DNA helicase